MEMDTELPSKSIDILVVLYVFHKRWRIGKMRREDAQGASERFGRTHVTFADPSWSAMGGLFSEDGLEPQGSQAPLC